MRNSVWFCTRSEWACSPIGRPPTSPIHSVRYWIGYSRLGMLLDMVISGSSLTFLPSKRCIAAWILSSKNCSITGYVIINAFCHNNTKTGTRQFFKNFFFNNESHFMPFLSALDRNTYFSHKFFTVISNAIVYERDFSRKTNNL